MPATTKAKKVTGANIDYTHEFGNGDSLVRLTYTDERGRRDSYFVTRAMDSLDVEWSHTAEPLRTYRVTCTLAGIPISCTCKGSEFTGNCRHRKGTAALLERGFLDNGPERGEEPDSWLADEERVEMEADYDRLCGRFPKVSLFRAD